MKSSIYISFFLLILNWDGYGQSNTKSLDTTRQIVASELGIDRSRSLVWQNFADSINTYRETSVYPDFLLDDCLDWKTNYWPGLHSPTSIRWKILSLVTDRTSLKLLLKDKPRTLKLKCSLRWNGDSSYPGDLTPPLNNISTHELIKRRIKELNIPA